jgi:hypothetical protein
MPKQPIYYPVNAAHARLGSVIAGFLTQPDDTAAFLCYAYFLSTMTRESSITAFVGSSESSAKGFVGMTRPSYKSFMAMQVPKSIWRYECCPTLANSPGVQLKILCDSAPASYYKVPQYANETVDIHAVYLFDTRNILCDVMVTLWPISDDFRTAVQAKQWNRVADIFVQAYCSHWLGRPVSENITVWSDAKLVALKRYWHTTRFMAQTFERVVLLAVQKGVMTDDDARQFIDAIASCQLTIASLAGHACDYIASLDNINQSIALGPDGTSRTLGAEDSARVAAAHIGSTSGSSTSPRTSTAYAVAGSERRLNFTKRRRLL